MRWRLDVAYDGTDFHGYAAQPGLRTVAGVLTEAVNRVRLDWDPASLTCAGRTDAGVHATGQVVHLDIDAGARAGNPGGLLPGDLVRRLTAVLPNDVVVRAARPVPDAFDARFAALWRRYVYRVIDRMAARDPMRRGFTWHLPRATDLDVAAMNRAAAGLVGEHDFAAYCKWRAGASTVRTLQTYTWARNRDQVLVAEVRADAFCHSMVRALVGAVVAVGQGRREIGWPAQVLAEGNRSSGIQVAPAHGLCLAEVGYPDDADLAEQVRRTRVVRGPVRIERGQT